MRILHIDMDAFFAAVETRRRPDLAGKPVIVGGHGNPQERAVVSAASYEARRFGVHSGMALRQARQLCPKAVFLPVDLPAYRKVSRRIKKLLRKVSPVMEDLGIDEACLDITHLQEAPELIGRTFKERILHETGLTCSVGVAPNKLLAKMAAELEKPDGLVVLSAQDVPRRIWPLPVRKLLFVGPKTEERLQEMGVRTIGELAKVPLTALEERFGSAHAHWLFLASRGIDERPLVIHREPKSIGRETTFQHDVDDPHLVEETLDALERDVVARMRRRGYRGREVTVKVRYADFETHTHALSLKRDSDDPETIRRLARRCLKRFELNRKVRLVGVRIGELERRADDAQH